MEGDEAKFSRTNLRDYGEYRRRWGVAPFQNQSFFEGKWRQKWSKSVIWKVRDNVSAPAQLDFLETMAKKGGALPREEHAVF